MSLESELSILEKYRLTPNELMFIQTLLVMQEDGNDSFFAQYMKILKLSGVSVRDLIQSLQDKEIVLKSYKIKQQGEQFDPYEVPFNKNFVKNIYKASFAMGEELFEVYPQFGTVNNCLVSLRGVSKRFDSLEDAYFRYSKDIGWSPEKHNHIIELVKWAADNQIINFSLSSFIIDRRWNDLEALRDGNTVGSSQLSLL